MTRIAVFVSGGGTNLQALIDAEQSGLIHSGRIELVIASRDGVYALERAKQAGIPSAVVARKGCTQAEFEAGILEKLDEYVKTREGFENGEMLSISITYVEQSEMLSFVRSGEQISSVALTEQAVVPE